MPGTRLSPTTSTPAARPNSSRGRRARPAGPGAEPADGYVYDPADPVPTLGGSTCCGEDITPISMGPRDQRTAEWRPDVLVYSTPPLEADVEVTGPIQVVLWAASSAPDTDFTAKLVDVFPSGYVMNVAQGILSARDAATRSSGRAPSRPAGPTASRSIAGRRRTCSGGATGSGSRSRHRTFPSSTGTRTPAGRSGREDTDLARATQTVYHDAQHPSHILLPIVD